MNESNQASEKNYMSVIPIGNMNIELFNLYDMNVSSTLSGIIHTHSHYELHIVLDGETELNIDGAVCTLQKNQILILPPNCKHFSVKHSENFKTYTFSFDFKPCKKSQNLKKGEYGYFTKLFCKKEPIKISCGNSETDIIKNILKCDILSIYGINKINLLVANFFLEMSRILDDKKNNASQYSFISSDTPDLIRKFKIETFFLQYPLGKHSLENLSKALYLSHRQTSRVVKELFGMSFKELSLSICMPYTKQQIEQKTMPLNKLAESIGFSSYAGFCVAYKKFFGHLPSQDSH